MKAFFFEGSTYPRLKLRLVMASEGGDWCFFCPSFGCDLLVNCADLKVLLKFYSDGWPLQYGEQAPGVGQNLKVESLEGDSPLWRSHSVESNVVNDAPRFER